MAELSPVETLREAVDLLRGDSAHWIERVHPDVAEALAALFEKLAWLLQLDSDLIGRVGNEEVVAVARVLLGVPDGR